MSKHVFIPNMKSFKLWNEIDKVKTYICTLDKIEQIKSNVVSLLQPFKFENNIDIDTNIYI